MEALKQKVDELEVKLARCGGNCGVMAFLCMRVFGPQQQFGNSDCGSLCISSLSISFPPPFFLREFFDVDVVLHRFLFIFFNGK